MAHVLVVDDSEFDRRMIMRALSRTDKSLGFAELSNGSGVLETLKLSLPDLILLDIRMPGPSGFEVLDAIKGHENFNSCNVVMISGSKAKCDKQMAEEKGAAAYFPKPNSKAGYMALAERISETYLQFAA